MSLSGYLRGTPSSPNGWWLEHRHAEGGVWSLLHQGEHASSLCDEVLGLRYSAGDLVRLRNTDGRTTRFWISTDVGMVDAKRPPGVLPGGEGVADWETAWEGPRATANGLLAVIEAYPRHRLLGCAVDLVEDLALRAAARELDPVPTGPQEVRDALRAWARGEGSPDSAVAAMRRQPREVAEEFPLLDEEDLFYLAMGTLTVPLGSVRREFAALVDRIAPTNRIANELFAELAPAVRRHFPLPVVLLLRAGQNAPYALGF